MTIDTLQESGFNVDSKYRMFIKFNVTHQKFVILAKFAHCRKKGKTAPKRQMILIKVKTLEFAYQRTLL